ncbi:MAG TPA: hypothetical protein VFC78_03515, partial [Tepidisphaeraceae bacterium]|nr:hypothetical protein [Tepidisphaeraceae bacterium]
MGVDAMQAGLLTGTFTGLHLSRSSPKIAKPAAAPAALKQLRPSDTAADPSAISINFEGGTTATPPLPPQSLAATDTAGVIPEANWNNAPTNIGTTATVDSPTPGALVDSTGTAVAGASVTWTANNVWGVSQAASTAGTTGDRELMTGYLDLNEAGPAGKTTSIAVTGVPYATYDVYVYVGSDGNGRVGHGTIGAQSVYFTTSDAPFGGYVQATGTSATNSNASNYLLFQGVQGSSFTYNQNGDTSNVGVHGIEIVDLFAPAAPTLNPAAANDKTVVLTWNSVPTATSYDVYRSDPSNTTPAKIATGLTNTTYTDNSVTNNTTYTYYVTADNAAGASPASNTVQATPQPIAPATPTGVATQNGSSSIGVYWQPPQFASSYTVQRATDSPTGTYTVITPTGGVTGTSFIDTTAVPGHVYYYEVSASNTGGTSAFSTPGVAGQVVAPGFGPSSIGVNFTGGGNGGALPTALAATDVAGLVPAGNYNNENGGTQTNAILTDSGTGAIGATLSYTSAGDYSAVGPAVTPAGGDEKLNDGFIFGTQIATTDVQVNSVPYSHFDLYVYELNDGAGRLETTSLVTPPGTTSGAATYYSLSANPTDNGHIDGNSGTPYVYTPATDTTAVGTPNADYVEFPALSPATAGAVTNGVELQVGSSNGNSFLNGVQIVNDPWQGDPLSAPVLNAPSAGPNQVQLTWMPSANAFYYTIYRQQGTGAATPIATHYGGTSYTDTGLTNGTAYSYYIVANNTVSLDNTGAPLPTPINQTSSPSNTQTVTPEPVAPAAPTGVTAQGGVSSINVSFQPSLFATSYSVQRATDSATGTYTVITPAGGVTSGTSFSDTTAQEGHTYYYEVAATNAGGTSAYSAPSAGATLVGTAVRPTAISVNFSGGRGGPVNLAPGDIAGVVPEPNYNNQAGGTQTAVALSDDGATANGATLTYAGGGNYAVNAAPLVSYGSPDEALNDGFVYGTTDVKVNNVPYSHFDLYAYELNDAAGRVETTTLVSTPSTTGGATVFYGSSAPPTDADHVDGNPATPYLYTQSTDTVAPTVTAGGVATPNGDYVEFPELAPATAGAVTNGVEFSTSATGNGYLNGFQIVNDPWQGDPLAAPVLNAPVAGNNQVQLTWTSSANAFYYTVYRQAGTGAATAVATNVDGTSYTDAGLTNGTAYTYYVVANNTVTLDNTGAALPAPINQTSPASNSQTVTPASALVPAVQSTTIGDGTAQRSEVRHVTVAFNEAVTLAPGAITLALLNTTGSGSGTNDGAAPTDESTGLTWA